MDRNTEHHDVPSCLRVMEDYRYMVEEQMSSLRLLKEYKDAVKLMEKKKDHNKKQMGKKERLRDVILIIPVNNSNRCDQN